MSGSNSRKFQRVYRVTGRYLDSEALIALLYPYDKEQRADKNSSEHKSDAVDQKPEHPLKEWLKQRLGWHIGGLLFNNKNEKNKKKLSDDELLEALRSGTYRCCIATIETEGPPFLVGYKFYKKPIKEDVTKLTPTHDGGSKDKAEKKQVTAENATEFILTDTAVTIVVPEDEEEDKQITAFLEKIPFHSSENINEALTITINSAATIKNSLYELALHVKRSTSFWYGGFFGSRKEEALIEIANRIRIQEAEKINHTEVVKYLFDIIRIAFETRGAGQLITSEKGKDMIIPTKSGAAFVEEVFCKGGRFTNLRHFLRNDPEEEEKAEEVNEEDKKKKNKKEFDLFYRELMQKVQLESKIIKKGCRYAHIAYQEVKAASTEGNSPHHGRIARR